MCPSHLLRFQFVFESSWCWCSGKNDVIDGDEDEFDAVSDESHDEEAHHAGLQDLHVLLVVWLLALLVEHD